MTVVTPSDRPKSVRYRFVIKLFGGVFVLSCCPFDISVCWYKGPDPHPVWLFVGTPSAFGTELGYRLRVEQPNLMDVPIYFDILLY